MNWLKKISMPLQPGYEEYDLSEMDEDYSKNIVPDLLKNKEVRSLDGNPFTGYTDGYWGGKIYIMDIAKEIFLHFTTKQHAPNILRDGTLRMIKTERPGILATCCVSTTYGEFIPSVQLNAQNPEDLVAIIFQTDTLPGGSNHADEVTWHGPIDMKNPRVVSFQEGVSLLKNSPVKLEDDDYVAYISGEMM